MSEVVATSESAGAGPSLGLRGPWAQAANMTAVALIGLLLWRAFDAGLEQIRDDRALCRQGMERIEMQLQRQGAAIEALTAEMRAWRKGGHQ